MHILHVISSPAAGGAEVYVKDLAKELVALGHSVHIGFLESAEDAGRNVDFQRGFLNELKAVGVNFFFIGHHSRWRVWAGAMRVRRYVQRNGIDIYHAHLTYGVLFGALIDIPRLYTHHSVIMRIGRPLFFLMGQFVDQFVGISNVCAKALSEYSARSVTTIFNGVDFQKFSSTKIVPRELNRDVRCVAVGRICKHKNFQLLVRAVALMPDEVRSRLLVEIAGEGSEDETAHIEAQIVNEGVESNFRLLGYIGDIPDLLARSDLLLMSSAVEGLPIVLIEAAASGLPCVVTDAGGCREVIEICQNGVVVELDNARALANAIEDVIGDPVQFKRFSVNALNESAAFSIENAAASHISVYRQLSVSPRAQITDDL